MKKPLKEYTIQFIGLKQGEHDFEYTINKTFFEYFDYDEFNDANIKLSIVLNKKTTLLELHFKISGSINTNCDVTNESYNQDLSNEFNLIVKFGDEYNNENEDILIVPHGTYEINVAQYIYELIVLSIPAKRVHPGVLDGTLQSDILNKLKELSPKQTNNNNKEIDPRWDTLKKLLTDK